MANSGYGKNAQNVVQKTAWTALKDLGCSAITNPVSAMMITSNVQVELIAAQNQIKELGYMSCSVTTDGFISNCPEHIWESLDLYGLRIFMEASRAFLTDDDTELWEAKHHQDDLINFTTRSNVSLHFKNRDGYDGVCAHNSTKSGYECVILNIFRAESLIDIAMYIYICEYTQLCSIFDIVYSLRTPVTVWSPFFDTQLFIFKTKSLSI